MFTTIWVQEQILCEHLGVRFHLTALFKILKTCPSASHAKQLLEGMQQNKTPEKITESVLRPKMCNILTRILNSSVHTLFSEKTALAN